MTKTMELPQLEWTDGLAPAQPWMPMGDFYVVERGGGWRWYSPNRVAYESGFKTEAEAKQAAQAHFESRLQEPMDFGAAMAAVARGCEVERKNITLYQSPLRLKIGESTDWLLQTLANGDECSFTPSRCDITATDWHFYFPPKQEKVYAKVHKDESWTCPECDFINNVGRHIVNRVLCKCGITLHRKGA